MGRSLTIRSAAGVMGLSLRASGGDYVRWTTPLGAWVLAAFATPGTAPRGCSWVVPTRDIGTVVSAVARGGAHPSGHWKGTQGD